MGPLMVTFSKTQNNVTTAAFAAWSLQCHYGVTTMSLQSSRNGLFDQDRNSDFAQEFSRRGTSSTFSVAKKQ